MAQVTATQDSGPLDPELKRLAIAVVTGVMMVVLDTTIISVGIHELGTSLHASVSTIQWVSTAYLLSMFMTIPMTGWAQSRLGSKKLWMLSLVLFLVGSLLCASAWNATSLILFRTIQGVGGGVMMPLMTTVLMQAAHGRPMGRLMAAVALPASLGPVLGPVLGGVILNYLSWHWIFLINLPVGIVGLVMAQRLLPESGPGLREPLDVVGVLLVSPGVVGVIYGLTQVGEAGGFLHPRVLIPLLLGGAFLAAFGVWAQRKKERALIDVALFRHRPLTTSVLLLFLTGTSLYGAMLLLPLYWQELRGESPLGAGLLLIPQGLGALGSRTLAGRLTDTIGGTTVAAVSFGIMTVSTIPFAFATVHTATWVLMVALFFRGLGLGGVNIPLMTNAYIGLEREEMPDASIVTRVSQQLGGSFGTAVLAVILASAASSAVTLGGVEGAFHKAFWWAVGFTGLASLLAVVLPRRLGAAQPAAVTSEA